MCSRINKPTVHIQNGGEIVHQLFYYTFCFVEIIAKFFRSNLEFQK